MNYYERYPGDYAKDTAHLSLAEHGAYTLLLDHYYATESGQNIDKKSAVRICSADTKKEREAVQNILSQFFPVNDDGSHYHARADKEISKAINRMERSRSNGKKGGRPKNKKPTGLIEDNLKETQTITQTEPRAEPEKKPTRPQTPPKTPSGGGVFAAAGISDARNRPVDDWHPSVETFDALEKINTCPNQFIIEQIAEFKLYWRDRGESHVSWDSKFIKSCAGQWKKHGHDWQENPTPQKKSTRDRSLGDDLNDRSWAG